MSKRIAAYAAKQCRVAAHPEDWAPHEGPQMRFLRLTCFEALYGGAAGGGKSDALLIDAIRYVGRGYGVGYSAILFRRTYPDLERSLIVRSRELYPMLGGVFNETKHLWTFPDGETVRFAHMLHEHDVLAHKSAAYQFVGFDELTSFTEYQYTYMFSRLRSSRGVPCRIRGASNPGDVGHAWVRRRFFPWVSRSAANDNAAAPGEIRYYVKTGDTEKQVPKGAQSALSRTFIPASLWDNPTLDERDPAYRARLESLPPLEKKRLLDGDWDAEPAKKDFYDRALVAKYDCRPAHDDIIGIARAWDFAGSKKRKGREPDWTAGVLGAWLKSGVFCILHVIRFQGSPAEVYAAFERWATVDKESDPRTVQVIPQDPGSAGLFVVDDFLRTYPQFAITARRPSDDKPTRFRPASSRALAGRFAFFCDGSWDAEAYHGELESFPLGSNDDQVDATSDAFAVATARPVEEDEEPMIIRGNSR